MSQEFTQALELAAMQCATLRIKKICKDSFDSSRCTNCKYYIKRFVATDPSHVELFMLQAEHKAAKLYYSQHSSGFNHTLASILLIVALFLGVGQYTKHDSIMKHGRMVFTQPPRTSSLVGSEASFQKIGTTLDKVAVAMARGADVNGDGEITCVDAAVLFYQHYPHKSEVRILVNQNPSTGMNHAFNAVKISGVWKAIEPQARFNNHRSYWMKDIWGGDYNWLWNRNQTQRYLQYVK